MFCTETLPQAGDKVFVLQLGADKSKGASVVLRWCQECAQEDPLHIQAAEADAADNDDAFSQAYMAMHRRCVEKHPQHLRACFDVRRDVDHPHKTMRGNGLSWGLVAFR